MKSTDTWHCNCVGPQEDQPYCPCMMRTQDMYKKDVQQPDSNNETVEDTHE